LIRVSLRLVRVLIPVLFVASCPFTARAQASRPASLTRKHKAVWTNDDLASIRKASDVYLDQRSATDEATGKASAVELTPKPGDSGVTLPKTLEEADQRIAATTKGIDNRELAIRMVEQRLESAPQEQRAELQRQIDLLKPKLEDTKRELKALQTRRQELITQPGQDSAAPTEATTRP
jgi:chromosome segregation ATPase